MIIVKMMGNLGNQLFIYAYARALQLEYGDKLFFDLSALKRYYYKANYKLESFNITKDIIYDKKELSSNQKAKNFIWPAIFHVEQKIQRTLHKNYSTSDKLKKRWFSCGCFFNFDRHYFQYDQTKKKDKYVYGYFQSTKYFYKIEDILKNELRVITPLDPYDERMLKQIDSSNSVAVSIRTIYDERGDSFIEYDYYFRAMEKMMSLLDNPVFFVFTDNVDNAKRIQFPANVIFVEQKEACSQLRLLYSCKHFILANSTFSWWGAYLSSNKEKRIIMPFPWDKQGKARKDIYFDNCININCTFRK